MAEAPTCLSLFPGQAGESRRDPFAFLDVQRSPPKQTPRTKPGTALQGKTTHIQSTSLVFIELCFNGSRTSRRQSDKTLPAGLAAQRRKRFSIKGLCFQSVPCMPCWRFFSQSPALNDMVVTESSGGGPNMSYRTIYGKTRPCYR